MARNIKIASGKFRGFKEVSSDAKTWGELKDVLSSNSIDTENMRATVKETRNTLDNNAAQLPDGDFGLFLTSVKVKSGNTDSDEAAEVSESGMAELRRFASAVGISVGSNPRKADLASRIAAYNLGKNAASGNTEGVDFDEIDEAVESLGEAIEAAKENAGIEDEFMKDFKEFNKD